MVTELEELIRNVMEAILENQPRKNSERYNVGKSDDTVTAGTVTTVTFTLADKYVTRLAEAYTALRTNCAYLWNINGKTNELCEIGFIGGLPITAETIVLKITNSGATDQSVPYYIKGWGDYKGGG